MSARNNHNTGEVDFNSSSMEKQIVLIVDDNKMN